MPIYEYECISCNNRFELKQGFDAETTQSCPLCQSMSRRKFHAPTVIYKGSGFYTTDYARKDQPNLDGGSGSNGTTAKTATPAVEKETSSKSAVKEVAKEATKEA
ncbi:MAG: zinc ribbon domain-containing protein [Chloroflexi bacterium]|nr:zinc ribbon domain-containing protein [Chloroflexota bacterium]